MKKTVLFLCIILGAFSHKLKASPGDTTIVTIFDNLEINHYGDFDTIVKLPNSTKQFQKIRLLYTLGRRACPGEQYCGSWDYTSSVYAKNIMSTNDSLELMRVITPYATDWPLTRKFTYVEEVTDFTSILQDSVAFKYHYEGYSWGFTLTLKVEMIEGIAPRKAISVEPIYSGHFNYGSTSDPIENHLIAKTFTYNAPATSARIRNIITGHGMDNTGCSEFCSKWYQQKINGTSIGQVQLWKSDCGLNNLYPQTGTWLFERANWCPGEKVKSIYHDLTNTSAGNSFTTDMDMQPYTATPANVPPSYYISSQLITYAAPSHQLDAAVTDIIAPSTNENYNRFNPICSNPIIKVRNEGTQVLTSMRIAYKIEGGQNKYYNWSGNLNFMEETEINLGAGLIVPENSPSNQFVVEIVEINGQNHDETSWNNFYRSTFATVPSYPSTFRVNFKTNGSVNAATSYSETDWKILDADGNMVASRTNNAINTTYLDTVSLPLGCYTFVMDDAGCDGISWWYYPNYNPNPGNGQIRFQKATSAGTVKSFNGDFGCQLIQRFVVDGTTNTFEEQMSTEDIVLYPNPAQDFFTIEFPFDIDNISYEILSLNGEMIRQGSLKTANSNTINIHIEGIENGSYLIRFNVNNSKLKNIVKKFNILR